MSKANRKQLTNTYIHNITQSCFTSNLSIYTFHSPMREWLRSKFCNSSLWIHTLRLWIKPWNISNFFQQKNRMFSFGFIFMKRAPGSRVCAGSGPSFEFGGDLNLAPNLIRIRLFKISNKHYIHIKY